MASSREAAISNELPAPSRHRGSLPSAPLCQKLAFFIVNRNEFTKGKMPDIARGCRRDHGHAWMNN